MSLQTANSCTETPPPYGKTNYELNLGVSVNTLYTGQQFDREAALYYYNARYYDPQLGRFIQPDTIIPNPGDSQAYNRYAYCRNNPIMLTDPSGHNWVSSAWNDVQEVVEKIVPNEAKPVVAAVAGVAAQAGAGMLGVQNPIALGAIGGFASSFTGSYLAGGSIENCMVSGCIGAGVGAALGAVPMGNNLSSTQYFFINVGKGAAAGAAGGAANAAYYGGDVGEAALYGAASGAASGAAGHYFKDNALARNMMAGAAGGAAGAAVSGEDIGKAMLKGAAYGGITAGIIYHPDTILDVIGKIWTLPNTLFGLAYGGVGHLLGLAMGTQPSITFSHNAINFINNPLCVAAITFGNTVVYGPNWSPSRDGWTYATHADWQAWTDGKLNGPPQLKPVNIGLHEQAHTMQYQFLGPFYCLAYLLASPFTANSPWERAADNWARNEGSWR